MWKVHVDRVGGKFTVRFHHLLNKRKGLRIDSRWITVIDFPRVAVSGEQKSPHFKPGVLCIDRSSEFEVSTALPAKSKCRNKCCSRRVVVVQRNVSPRRPSVAAEGIASKSDYR